jgi:hypothetical protein
MEKLSLTDRVRNEEVLLRFKEVRNILHKMKERKLTGLVTSCVEIAFYKTFLKEKWREGYK